MPHDGQLKWAAQLDPGQGPNMPETRIYRKDVSVIAGNVTRLPPLGGRPCFGNPIAWLVHGVKDTLWASVNGEKTIDRSRCGRCQAREGCQKVAESRLAVSPTIAQAAGEFRAAGGRDALASNRFDTARRTLKVLREELEAHGRFDSVNDEFAKQWPSAERDRVRHGAAIRKQAQRARDADASRRKNEIPAVLDQHLPQEAHYRRIRYRAFRNSGQAPRRITVDPNGENDRFTVDVWLARERLHLTRKPTTAHGIATAMIHADQDYGLSHGVLRDRVKSALVRIALLETTRFPGTDDPVWPVFDADLTVEDLLLLEQVADG